MAGGMIAVSCPECGASIRLHEADWAEGIPCPACTTEIRKPTEEELREKRLAELKSQLKKLDDNFVEMQDECSTLRDRAKESRTTATRFERDSRELEAKLKDAANPALSNEGNQRVAEMEGRLKQVKEEIHLTKEKAKNQLKQLTARANKAVQERIENAADQMHQTYTVSRQELIGELTQFATETETLRGDLARREKELAEYEQETSDLRAKLEEVQSCLKIARTATATAESRAAELAPQAAIVEREVSKDELERLRTSNDRLLRQLPAIQDHHARLEAYVKDLKARLAAITKSSVDPTPNQPVSEPTSDSTPPFSAASEDEAASPEKPPELRPRPGTVRLKPMKRDQ